MHTCITCVEIVHQVAACIAQRCGLARLVWGHARRPRTAVLLLPAAKDAECRARQPTVRTPVLSCPLHPPHCAHSHGSPESFVTQCGGELSPWPCGSHRQSQEGAPVRTIMAGIFGRVQPRCQQQSCGLQVTPPGAVALVAQRVSSPKRVLSCAETAVTCSATCTCTKLRCKVASGLVGIGQWLIVFDGAVRHRL